MASDVIRIILWHQDKGIRRQIIFICFTARSKLTVLPNLSQMILNHCLTMLQFLSALGLGPGYLDPYSGRLVLARMVLWAALF